MPEQNKPVPAESRDLCLENRKNISLYGRAASGADEARRKRDEQNRLVAEAKKKRTEVVSKIDALWKQVAEKEEALRKIGPTGRASELEDELKQKEWVLQTEATNPRKEKELSKEIKGLEKELAKAKEAEAVRREAWALKKTVNELSTEARTIHETLVMHARESEALHKKMFELRCQADALRRSISENLGKLDVGKEAKEAAERERRENGEKEKAETARAKEIESRKKNEELAREAEKILEEFRKGKKISSSELQVLQTSIGGE